MALALNGAGYLDPGLHQATEAEVKQVFVTDFATSQSRLAIFEYWLDLRRAIRDFVTLDRQVLDGSFVTDKVDPGDIDLITYVDAAEVNGLPRYRRLMFASLIQGHYTQALWRCDSFPAFTYPSGDPNHQIAEADAQLKIRFFSGVRGDPSAEKGLIEVLP